MVVYYSILAYSCIISLVGCSLQQRKLIGQNKKTVYYRQNSISVFFAILSIALLVFFVAERTSYGDTTAYIAHFNSLPTDLNKILEMWKENDRDSIGFWALTIICKRYISQDVKVWFFLIAIFQAAAVEKFYRHYSQNFTFSIFLFIATTDAIAWMMNGIRQFTAVCFIMYFFDYLLNRKFLKFLIVIVLAYLLHSSAIVWLPVYFIVRFKPFSWQIWVCVVITLIVVFFIDSFTNFFDVALEGTKYEGANLTAYDNQNGIIDDGVNPVRVLVYAIPPAIALYKKDLIKEIGNPFIDISINLATVCVGVYLIGMVTSGVMVGRIPMYFELANYVLLPWLLKNVFFNRQRFLLTLACIIGYMSYFFFTMVIQGAGYYVSSNLNMYYY